MGELGCGGVAVWGNCDVGFCGVWVRQCMAVAVCGNHILWELRCLGVPVFGICGLGELRCVAVAMWGSCIAGEMQCVRVMVVTKP